MVTLSLEKSRSKQARFSLCTFDGTIRCIVTSSWVTLKLHVREAHNAPSSPCLCLNLSSPTWDIEIDDFLSTTGLLACTTGLVSHPHEHQLSPPRGVLSKCNLKGVDLKWRHWRTYNKIAIRHWRYRGKTCKTRKYTCNCY